MNIQVYNDLILNCHKDTIFDIVNESISTNLLGIVDESISTNFLDGDAKLAWKNLQDEFEPSGGAAKVQLKQESQQLKLSSVEEDPNILNNQLELKHHRLKNLGAVIDDAEMILHILNH